MGRTNRAKKTNISQDGIFNHPIPNDFSAQIYPRPSKQRSQFNPINASDISQVSKRPTIIEPSHFDRLNQLDKHIVIDSYESVYTWSPVEEVYDNLPILMNQCIRGVPQRKYMIIYLPPNELTQMKISNTESIEPAYQPPHS